MGHAVGSDGPGTWRELDELVTRVVDKRAAIASLQADEAALLADAVDLVIARTEERRINGRLRADNDLPLREICAELGAAMRVSDRTVQTRIGDASTLVTSFSATHDAWRAGRIDAGHVSAILDAGAAIGDDEARGRYELRALEAALHESPGRLRAVARVIAARIDPESIDDRHRRARSQRGVRVIDLDDGMARLLADLPSTLAYAIHDRLTQMAHEVRAAAEVDAGTFSADSPDDNARPEEQSRPSEAGETASDAVTGPRGCHRADAPRGCVRTAASDTDSASTPQPDSRSIDELRADIVADLLLTSAPTAHGDSDALGAISGRVQVTIPVLQQPASATSPRSSPVTARSTPRLRDA